ncbi:hypothetical protein [Halobacillus amylolyticus]|uniref:Uncharacterized protein n=1 Tax=Halobacillus amylolyticus TaxID=2932259 RepID=A0ABY4H753_9BACI|nr:hypothetical protein [Halobacillus amylolyticus]UOR10273.1 hypothetical protein MUO15_11140 [Halobacillus amylolyticus]
MGCKYKRFIEEDTAFKDYENLFEAYLARELTTLEKRKIQWLAESEYETVGVIYDLIKELAEKK